MVNLQELQRQQRVFAEETFAFLLENSKVGSKFLKGYEFFRSYIGDAIITISYVFRKDYWKIFSRLRENLKQVKMFENYCMIIPVKKDKRYFYNILTRISLIFELSMYCYSEGFDYFKAGLKCVAEYEDLLFFESAGGWGRLGHTALFIASIGQPLTLIVSQHYSDQGKETLTFNGAFDALDKHFMFTGNINMLDGAEMYCLSELNKMFQTQTRKADTKCADKAQQRKEIGCTKYRKAISKAALADGTESARDLIIEYFKKCLFGLVSSKVLGYSVENLEESNLRSISNLNAFKEREKLNRLVESCGLQNPPFDLEVEFSDKKVVYIEQHKTSYSRASFERTGLSRLGRGKSAEEACVFEGTEGYSDVHSPYTDPCVPERNLLIPNQEAISLKYADCVPRDIYSATQRSEKVLSGVMSVKSDDQCQKIENHKPDENATVQEEFRVQPNFIVPQKYLNSRKFQNCRKSMHLYSVKMYPPSTRQKLDKPIKQLLDEHIENQNYNTMPSGDMLVCSHVSSAQKEDTLIILAESSTDDEVEADFDILMCLFKIIEIDSKDNESGYSLRSRQPKPSQTDRLRSDWDGAEIVTKETTASDRVAPSKFLRTVKRKPSGSILKETLHIEQLIKLYKKYFTPFLDVYFGRRFFPLETEVQCRKSGSIKSYCKYVFAVTASIMAKRKVLIDEPDETKRVLGIQLYEETFRPKILPLGVQRALDAQIRKHNYFSTSNGVYGVGPKRTATEENIWVILLSGKGNSDSFNFSNEDLREIPKIFRLYEPILEIFIPLPKEAIKSDIEQFELQLEDLVTAGFHVNQET